MFRFTLSRRRKEGHQGRRRKGTLHAKRRGDATLPLDLCLDILVLDNPATTDPSVRVAEETILALPGLG